jgi:hypothetical protein
MRSFDSISKNITQEIIREAVVEYAIHQIDHPYKESTDYDVIIDDRPYPPVAILGIASALATGFGECPKLRGGEGTPCFKKWEELGFEIVSKGSHLPKERKPKESESWPEYLDHLRRKYEFDPVGLLSLCLRLQPKRSIKRFLGRDDIGDIKQLGSKKDNFSIGGRNWFRTIEVAFTPTQLKLYLVTPVLDRNHHKSLRAEMDKKFNDDFHGALHWPITGDHADGVQMLDAKNACASYVSVTTESQCQSVIDWLSSEKLHNTRRLSFQDSKTAKLKSEKPELFEQTSDNEKLEANTSRLLESGLDEEPTGNPNPERSDPRESKGAFKRDPEVIAWVKQRAGGICELCEKEGPFLDKENQPYLEVHHIVPLAEGGPDTVDNAVALCPNCHRACHHGTNTNELAEILKCRVKEI